MLPWCAFLRLSLAAAISAALLCSLSFPLPRLLLPDPFGSPLLLILLHLLLHLLVCPFLFDLSDAVNVIPLGSSLKKIFMVNRGEQCRPRHRGRIVLRITVIHICFGFLCLRCPPQMHEEDNALQVPSPTAEELWAYPLAQISNHCRKLKPPVGPHFNV